MNIKTVPSILLLIAMVCGFANCQERKAPDYARLLEAIMPALGHTEVDKRRAAQEKWQELCFEASAGVHEEDRKAISKAMSNQLKPKASIEAKVFLLRQLERVGREECVEAVSAMLQDNHDRVHDGAMRALTANPVKQAGDALRDAFKTAQTIPRSVQLINALGYRAEVESVEILERYSSALHIDVMRASVLALARIEDAKAESAIEKLFDADLRPSDLSAYAQAYLTVARRHNKKGETRKAAEMFLRLEKEKMKTPIRLAVAKGRLDTCSALGDSAGELVESYLTGEDELIRGIAAGHVRELNDKSIAQLAGKCHRFPKAAQLAFLRAVGPTRRRGALPHVVKLLESEDADVRVHALNALAGLADKDTISLLVKWMEKGGKEGEAAARSIEKTFADGADAMIEDYANVSLDLEKRKRYLQILDRRRAVSAMKTFLREAEHEDRSVRDVANRILKRLASDAEVPALVKIMIKTKDRGEKDEWEKTIVSICRRNPDAENQVTAVLNMYQGSARKEQSLMLPLLGRLGHDACLKHVRIAVETSDDPEFMNAGVQALANWPNAKVTTDLMRVSTHQDKGLRIRSVRALARVVVMRDERSDAERLDLLKKVMAKAERDQERDLILDRAKAIRTVESLRFVEPFLENDQLKQRACQTVVELAHHRGLREPNQKEFDKALKRVIEISKDERLVNRAKGYMKK